VHKVSARVDRVRFLVDEALQDLVAQRLVAAGHSATHVRALRMRGATDDEVLAHAAGEPRVLVTADTDFGTILACRAQRSPACCCSAASVTPSTSEPAPSSVLSQPLRTTCPLAPSPSSKATAFVYVSCPSRIRTGLVAKTAIAVPGISGAPPFSGHRFEHRCPVTEGIEQPDPT
jgi:predicted nuclease of predicted toxin-antitoxin system